MCIRDRYAPIALFFIPVVLMALVLLGFMAIYWALSPLSIIESFKLSGSALFTLGSFTNDDPVLMVFEFAQALLGMILVALLIAYLPTMYSAFTRRETQVQLLEVRAKDRGCLALRCPAARGAGRGRCPGRSPL